MLPNEVLKGVNLALQVRRVHKDQAHVEIVLWELSIRVQEAIHVFLVKMGTPFYLSHAFFLSCTHKHTRTFPLDFTLRIMDRLYANLVQKEDNLIKMLEVLHVIPFLLVCTYSLFELNILGLKGESKPHLYITRYTSMLPQITLKIQNPHNNRACTQILNSHFCTQQ